MKLRLVFSVVMASVLVLIAVGLLNHTVTANRVAAATKTQVSQDHPAKPLAKIDYLNNAKRVSEMERPPVPMPMKGPPVFQPPVRNPSTPTTYEGPLNCLVEANWHIKFCQPIVRIPPIMPREALRSGHCDVIYTVKADRSIGRISTRCTDKLFKKSTIASIKKWKHWLRMDDGAGVSYKTRTRITYHLTDAKGHAIPE